MDRNSVSRRSLLVGSLAAGMGAGLRAETAPTRVRALSYNIRHGRGIDGKIDLDRIARVIRSVAPDIVALQEVDRGVRRSEGVDQPVELARLTDLSVVFERNIEHQGGDYGNAVLSRLPILRNRNVHLPSLYQGEQRGVLVVDLLAPDGKSPLRLFATHLDYRPEEQERLASAALIEELVAEAPDKPSLLAGDLNAVPESRTLAAFATAWTNTTETALPTFPVGAPTRQIDYILFRPKSRWKVVEVRVMDEAVASDHRPIFAILELLGTTP